MAEPGVAGGVLEKHRGQKGTGGSTAAGAAKRAPKSRGAACQWMGECGRATPDIDLQDPLRPVAASMGHC